MVIQHRQLQHNTGVLSHTHTLPATARTRLPARRYALPTMDHNPYLPVLSLRQPWIRVADIN
jgi:hypothetical protein